MSYAIEFGLVFLVVVLAGQSLRRKGRWSAPAYRNWVVAVGLLCAIGILLGWYADHRRREVRAARHVVTDHRRIGQALQLCSADVYQTHVTA